MKTFTTHLQAINPDTQELQLFAGPNILARDWDEAEDYCYRNGLGYLVVDGELNEALGTENATKLVQHITLN
ncbi:MULTISPECIES: hypothetical protein [Olivibacter]|jgi:hypothetical protein|uniref:Uncharacterized protein n=2 Tax=Sphingobacteriaceae TaxID=84566 RepID=F4CBU6_SPHS2|nr:MULTISPECIES: hypothetical protein [Olivibacter]MCL4639783.1 hypothetical protein [Olivibacter sp. UJ_SKK_5.1]MDM8173547.1 hypothetical protein [Olivibacter sp. 47]MDX3914634.1 hypothetical protein [Pseudosphingobacterium sp.]QEL03265.1 hypothetical protein FKG96_21375 [Olivibacter sp. LS-1]